MRLVLVDVSVLLCCFDLDGHWRMLSWTRMGMSMTSRATLCQAMCCHWHRLLSLLLRMLEDMPSLAALHGKAVAGGRAEPESGSVAGAAVQSAVAAQLLQR